MIVILFTVILIIPPQKNRCGGQCIGAPNFFCGVPFVVVQNYSRPPALWLLFDDIIFLYYMLSIPLGTKKLNTILIHPTVQY